MESASDLHREGSRARGGPRVKRLDASVVPAFKAQVVQPGRGLATARW